MNTNTTSGLQPLAQGDIGLNVAAAAQGENGDVHKASLPFGGATRRHLIRQYPATMISDRCEKSVNFCRFPPIHIRSRQSML